jgi:hypothetical protein
MISTSFESSINLINSVQKTKQLCDKHVCNVIYWRSKSCLVLYEMFFLETLKGKMLLANLSANKRIN